MIATNSRNRYGTPAGKAGETIAVLAQHCRAAITSGDAEGAREMASILVREARKSGLYWPGPDSDPCALCGHTYVAPGACEHCGCMAERHRDGSRECMHCGGCHGYAERVLREQFPEDRDRITLIFGECERAARAIDEARAEDIRRAAEGRRVLG